MRFPVLLPAAALFTQALAISVAWAQAPEGRPEIAQATAQPSDPALPLPLPAPAPEAEQPPPVEEPKLQAPPGPRHGAPSESLVKRLEWRWPEFTFGQVGLSLGQGAVAVGSVAIPGLENWKTPNAFDEAVRDVFRIPNIENARYARDFSDVGLVLLLNQQLVDTLFVTWWFHDKGSTALQMGLIDAQTISFSAGVNSLVAGVVGRERPYGRALCYEGPEATTTDCLGSNRYRSYYSGHASAAFTFAALTCVHHINLPLYGGGAREAIPCIGGMLVAGAVAMLRVASDQHYFSDVLTGAVVGTASGFAIPYLFHYAWDKDKEPNAALRALGVVTLNVAPTPTGVQAAGNF